MGGDGFVHPSRFASSVELEDLGEIFVSQGLDCSPSEGK